MLIVLEGGDGCGKTTVAEELGKRLNAEVMPFPNDAGVTGPLIRAYLKRQWWVDGKKAVVDLFGKKPDAEPFALHGALAFQALQVMNRMEYMGKLMDASLDEPEGPRIILARYWQSGWVYGGLDGLDRDFLKHVHSTMAEPHLNILLDISADEAMRRRRARDGSMAPERYEAARDFVGQVVDSYRTLWSGQPGKSWVRIDANQPFQQVCDLCYARILESLPR